MTRARSRKGKRRRTGRGRRLLVALLSGLAIAGGVVTAKWWRERARASRVAALERERDGLEERLALLVAKDPVMAEAPTTDVILGLPERVGSVMFREVATGFLGETRLELHDLRVRKSGRVMASTPFGRMTSGDYSVDLRIHEVKGVLEARAPRVSFEGPGIDVQLPVQVSRGEGRATLLFRWSSRGLAGAVCGDVRARVPVTGTVVPRTYTAKGRFDLSLRDGTLVAAPVFPDLSINLVVEPSEETWRAVARVLAERGAGCRAALKLVDVPSLLRRLLARGFDVKVPPRVLKPLRLSMALRRDVTVEGRTYVLEAAPRRIAGAPGFLWYGSDVKVTIPELDRRGAGPPAFEAPDPGS